MGAAADFIREKIGEYGIFGSNNVVPNARHEPLSPLTYDFTKGNHLKWGFDRGEYNRRPSGSSGYWIEYGQPTRSAITVAGIRGNAVSSSRIRGS